MQFGVLLFGGKHATLTLRHGYRFTPRLDLFATMRSTGAISVAAGRAHQGGEGEREDE